MIKTQVQYYVSYFYTDGQDWGIDGTTLYCQDPIQTGDDISAIIETLKGAFPPLAGNKAEPKRGSAKVVLLSWQRLPNREA
jgi:hypothetical protein